jgi:glycosyltransferase involved in cell wall biosynthesis
MPLFSTVMPVYNHAAFVEEAVRSVLAQSWTDWELIIVDDGSTDGSERIVEELAAGEERIRVFHQANAGASAARAAGVGKATGQWLTFLDSDDLYYPTALADFHAYIQAHPAAQFIHGFRHRINSDGSITEQAPEYQDRPTGTVELFQRMFISHLCVCFSRSLLSRTAGYDPSLPCAEDYELYLRLSQACPLEPLGKATGLRRRHAGCISRQSGFVRMVEAEVLRRFIQRQGGDKLVSPQIVSARLARLYHSSAKEYFKERRYRESLRATAMGHRYRRTLRSTVTAAAARCLLPLARNDARPLPDLWGD